MRHLVSSKCMHLSMHAAPCIHTGTLCCHAVRIPSRLSFCQHCGPLRIAGVVKP
jgi:hypothetical protein